MTQDGVSSSTLTSTQAVNWDSIPIVDVVKFPSDKLHDIAFRTLPNCQRRMMGRALAEIDGPVTVKMFGDPTNSNICAIGAVPATSSSVYKPSNLQEVLVCGAAIITNNPYRGASSDTLTFLPGISTRLAGETSTPIVGKPPHLYFYAKTNASAAVDIYVQISYKLRLSGIDWLSPYETPASVPPPKSN